MSNKQKVDKEKVENVQTTIEQGEETAKTAGEETAKTVEEKKEPENTESLVVKNIPIDSIESSDYNVRKLNIEKEVMSLAKTMEDPAIGLETPIRVRKKGNIYVVYDGQRRVMAAKMLGWKTIPGIIISEDKAEEDDLIRSLIHDTEHLDIDPEDKAAVVGKLLAEYGNDYRIVAKKLHKPINTIQQWYGWNSVPKEVKEKTG